jgi:hypothetical protein
VLNCRSSREVSITPTFYTLEGQPYVGDEIVLHPAEIRFVDTKSLIPKKEKNRHKWGGMSFTYVGGFMEAWAQLTLHGIQGGGSVNVLFTVLSQNRSNTSEAVWWVPRNGKAAIALGNSSDQPVLANLVFSNRETKAIRVAPFATEVMRLDADASHPRLSDQTEGVSITHTGPAGCLIPTGITSSVNGKFASMIRFYDTANFVQQNLYGNNLRLDNAVPHMMLRNSSPDYITATPIFLPTTGNSDQAIRLRSLWLAPYETTGDE